MVKNLITPGQTLRRIVAREVFPVYAFFGEDSFFQDLIIDGIVDVFKGERVSFVLGVDSEQDILNSLNMGSLFSTKEIIIIRNAKKISSKYQQEIIDYCSSPIDDKVVVFIYEDPYSSNKFINEISSHATSIDMRVPFPNKMKEWISYYLKQNKINISPHIISQLIDNYGYSTKAVINEIDKINIFSMGKSNETDGAIIPNHYKKETQLWKLVDAIGKRDMSQSINLYVNLHNNNTPLPRIVLNLLDFFRELINYKLTNKSGKFIRNKILLKNLNIYGGKYSMDDVMHGIVTLRNCDFMSKTSSIKEQYLVNSILVDICKGANVKS